MTVATPIASRPNGRAKARPPESGGQLYRGHPLVTFHVGDPIPTPKVPMRAVVRVTPDLARHWLNDLNHPNQRSIRERRVATFADDMSHDSWPLTPESLVFSDQGLLINGQNRLMAVTVHGQPVHFMVDFGWPDALIKYFDRGASRSNGDSLRVDGIANYTLVAATIAKARLFDLTVGTSFSWTARPAPSTSAQQRMYEAEPEVWHAAVAVGKAICGTYRAYAPTSWATAYVGIVHERGSEDGVREFFEEVLDGTGEPQSPSRRLIRQFARIKPSDTVTGDVREPVENIVRGFNAHRSGGRLGFVSQPRFTLTRPTTK